MSRSRWTTYRALIVAGTVIGALAIWFSDPDYPGLFEIGSAGRLHGLTEDAVVEDLGAPSNRRVFTMDHCCTELDGVLDILYPPERGDRSAIEIHELTWQRPRYALIVWFGPVGQETLSVSSVSWGRFGPSF